ncbi:hypothetical protein [Salinimicrobium terrae]|uniref:hypothetical protein n=1 Tax=Salinimicrobium terrae TaxID=470866 RepID=UPI0004086F7A|nr:hypothetical protein [Salinimicrobium terrae]
MKKVKQNLKIFFLLLGMSVILTGCQEMSSKMDEQLDNINKRAEELDSAVNRGLDKVENLDSTITAKSKRIKNLDSIVRKTTTRIDSLVNKSAKEINRGLN